MEFMRHRVCDLTLTVLKVELHRTQVNTFSVTVVFRKAVLLGTRKLK
jgi:hypothetical protein